MLTTNEKIKQVQFYGFVAGRPVFNLASYWNEGALYPSVQAALAVCPSAQVTEEAWAKNVAAALSDDGDSIEVPGESMKWWIDRQRAARCAR